MWLNKKRKAMRQETERQTCLRGHNESKFSVTTNSKKQKYLRDIESFEIGRATLGSQSFLLRKKDLLVDVNNRIYARESGESLKCSACETAAN